MPRLTPEQLDDATARHAGLLLGLLEADGYDGLQQCPGCLRYTEEPDCPHGCGPIDALIDAVLTQEVP